MPTPDPAEVVSPGGEQPALPASTSPLSSEEQRDRNQPASGRPRAARVADGAWLGGVCTGLAEHLGLPVLAVRIGFVALGLLQFVGVVVYAVLWLTLPAAQPTTAPGLASHDRTNLRTAERPTRRSAELGTVVAVGLLGVGLLWLVQASGWGLSQQIFWPIAFACVGVALVWRTADTTDERWRTESPGSVWLAPFVARGRLLTLARVILGLGLVGAAVGMVIASQAGLAELPRVFGMTGLLLAGTALVIAPWAYRSRIALQQAREEKVRADERADLAAHLHDSVLQTLALIQRRADDPRVVATLARKQERELRTWLYGDVIREQTVKTALLAAAAEVDDDRNIPVEVVCVGDCELTEELEAMIRAAREAMLNAAKHSGAPRIDVYAEVTEDLVEIFVRDRGRGFAMTHIGDDRMGVKGSIIGRMQRHGGSARIRSSTDDGTEVRLEMKR